MNNFSTLVAIITGLRSAWTSQAMRKLWKRVPVGNLRMLKDLTSFISREDDFSHIQSAVRALEETKTGMTEEGSSTRSSMKVPKEPILPAAVPFVGTHSLPCACLRNLLMAAPTGIYLSQLHHYSHLPDLIDPTAPTEAVGIDRNTNSFHAPAHPEVFSTLAPLPPSLQLEPLINVHKQRLIAGTIKSLVAGQHLASRVSVSVDRKLWQKCLKIRGLDQEQLQRAIAMYPES